MTTLDMTDETTSLYVQVCTIKAHLKLVKVGLKPPRGVTVGKLMERARKLTGKNVKGRDYDGAIKALEEKRDALLALKEAQG